jgi:single-strand DNA-binding protein
MPKGMNRALLLGYVGRQPEIRLTVAGTLIASFSFATADRQKDGQGNWVDRTEWHNLVAFNRTAEIVRDYVKKGTQLFIEGRIQTRSWGDKASGQRKIRTEVVVSELTLLSGARAEDARPYSGDRSGESLRPGGDLDNTQRETHAGYSNDEIGDQDIPF